MTVQTIGRGDLHPDLSLIFYDPAADSYVQVSETKMHDAIDRWRHLLVEQGGVTVGSRVGTGFLMTDLSYVSCVYALAELGAIVLILDKVPTGSAVKPRCRVLAPFDLYIRPSASPANVLAVGDWYARQQLDSGLWNSYRPRTDSEPTAPVTNGELTFMQCTTSGSTGEPVPVEYGHAWFRAVGDHCIRTFGFQFDDRVLHLSNLHHGGSSGCFFFPAMRACRQHYFLYGLDVEPRWIDRIVELIAGRRINRVMFPKTAVLEAVLSRMPAIQHQCVFYTLQANQKNWIQESRRSGIEIVSLFGASEILGPIFINRITPQTSDDHKVLDYGRPLDFYTVSVDLDQLHVMDRTYRTAVTNDIFTVDEQGHYHYGSRSDLIRINEVAFGYYQLTAILQQQFDPAKSALIADTTLNKIYLLLDHSAERMPDLYRRIQGIVDALAKIDPVLSLRCVDYVEFNHFVTGIKLNRELAITHFRQRFNLI
jgi:acyl-coenzyme A synthetase/AMP-(fatty) acid ligase